MPPGVSGQLQLLLVVQITCCVVHARSTKIQDSSSASQAHIYSNLVVLPIHQPSLLHTLTCKTFEPNPTLSKFRWLARSANSDSGTT